jgi:hypothetical protein
MKFAISVVVGAVCCAIGVFLGSAVFRGVSTVTLVVAAPAAVTVFGGLIYFLTTASEVKREGDKPLPKSTRNGRTIVVMLGLFFGTLLGVAFVIRVIIGLL